MVTTVDAITTPMPSRSDPVNFAPRGDQTLSELPVFQNQINALAGELNIIGATAENAIVASAAAVTAANYKGEWSAGRTYAVGDSVTDEGFDYQNKVDGNQGVKPNTDPTKWKPVITDRVGEIKYTFEAPGGTWKLCDGSLSPIADADGNFAATLNDAQKFVHPGKLADSTPLSGTCIESDWSDDSGYLAMAANTTPWIHVYKRTGSTFAKLANPSTLPSVGTPTGIAIAGNGSYVAITGPTSPYVEFYKVVDDVLTKLADPAALPAGQAQSVTMSSNGTYCAVGHLTSPYVTIYKRTGDTFAKLANPSTLPTATALAIEFSKDDSTLVLAETGVGTSVYDRTGDTFALFDVIANSNYGNIASISGNGLYVVGGEQGGTSTVYKRGDSAYGSIGDIDISSSSTDTSISPDGKNVVIVSSGAPYIARYRIVNDALLLLDDMDDMPSGIVTCAAFSGDNAYMMLGRGASPYFNVYKPTNYDTTAYFRTPYIEPVDTNGLSIAGLNAYLKVDHGGILNPPAQWADGLLQTVATLGELLGTSYEAGISVATQGYHAYGDWGHGAYLIKTASEAAADNDSVDEIVNVTIANGNVAILQIGESLNVKQAGAYGNGTDDDAVAIQAAEYIIAASQTTTTSTGYKAGRAAIGSLIFPVGQYVTSTQIVKQYTSKWVCNGSFDAAAFVEKRGTGANIRCAHNGTAVFVTNIFSQSSTSLKFANGGGFYGIGILGDLSAYPAAKGVVYQNGCKGQVIEGMFISHFHTNFQAQDCGEFYFKYVYSYYCKYGVVFDNCVDSWFTAGHFGSPATVFNAGGGTDPNTVISGGTGISLNGCHNFTFSGTRFQVMYNGDNVTLKDVKNILFNGCIIDEAGDDGAYIVYGAQNVKFSDCSFFRSHGASIDIYNEPVPVTNVDTVNDELDHAGTRSQFRHLRMRVSSTGTLPAGITGGTVYWGRRVNSTSVSLHPTEEDAVNGTNKVSITSAGSGTISMVALQDVIMFSDCTFDDEYVMAAPVLSTAPIESISWRGCSMYGGALYQGSAPTSNIVSAKLDIDKVSRSTTVSATRSLYHIRDGVYVIADTAGISLTLSNMQAYEGLEMTIENTSTGVVSVYDNDAVLVRSLSTLSTGRYRYQDDAWIEVDFDDYLVGTYTATLYDAISGGNASSTTATGRYTRQGGVVNLFIGDLIDISTAGMTAGNSLYLSLPFTPSARGQGTLYSNNVNFNSRSSLTVNADAGRAIFVLSGGGVASQPVKVSDITTGVSDLLGITLSYKS